MTVQIAALILLGLRLIAVGFIISVLAKQFRLFKLTIENELASFRLAMFSFTVVFLFGSLIPIAVDLFYGVIAVGAKWSWPLILYAASNAISALVVSILFWRIYDIVTDSLEEEQRIEDRRE